MNVMDLSTLNRILDYIDIVGDQTYVVTNPIILSGQRQVYEARPKNGTEKLVLKTCPLMPTNVARIKREIAILREIDSKYFPKIHFEFFATSETLAYFVDNLNPKTDQDLIRSLRAAPPAPFLVTVEEYIEHIPWSQAEAGLADESKLVAFLLHLFTALNILWEKKIVHRDLKPDNILVRPNFEPVVIDLGIAKSMKDGATNITHPLVSSPCTPAFAAPEQLTNNKAEVTYKADQFAIGIIFFRLLTKHFPYGDVGVLGIEGVVENFMTGAVADFRSFNKTASDDLVGFIHRLLMVAPFKRFRVADEILGVLEGIEKKRGT